MFNVVDTWWAGKISTDSLAALSLSFPIFMILLALIMGMGSGVGALIANALGAGKAHNARSYQVQGFYLGAILLAVVLIPLGFALPWLFQLFKAEGTLLQAALSYTWIILLGAPFFLINALLNSGLTARGDTKSFRNFLIIGFLVNLGLDPFFIVVIPLGEAGIALATVLVQLGGIGYMFWRFHKSGLMEGQTAEELRPNPKLWGEILGQSLPQRISMGSIAAGGFVINHFVTQFGTTALAAYGTAMRIEQIALLPTIGLSIALAAIVGQNNGAGNLKRVKQAFITTLLMGLVLWVALYTPLFFLAPHFMAFFNNKPEVVAQGDLYLKIQAITFMTYVVMNLSGSVLQGIKKPSALLWFGLSRQIVLPIPLFWLLVTILGLGLAGIWWGLVLVNGIAALATLFWASRQLHIARITSVDAN